MLKSFFTLNKSNRQWHLPIVAGLSVGIPLLVGWMLGNIEAAKLGSLAGLSILYIQSFGVAISATVLTAFSANPESIQWIEGVISYIGRQDNIAIREAAFFAFGVNLIMAIAALISIMLTIPKK